MDAQIYLESINITPLLTQALVKEVQTSFLGTTHYH
jgi:hypothetical protein